MCQGEKVAEVFFCDRLLSIDLVSTSSGHWGPQKRPQMPLSLQALLQLQHRREQVVVLLVDVQVGVGLQLSQACHRCPR